MNMALGVRGSNPIWLEVDLEGNLFDDNFYLYVLENVLPYMPATVYHDPDLALPWTNPIQFLGNGTLPNDIYFEEGKVYRLEFRQNNGIVTPSQSDPLIYEVNNYIAGSGGGTPIDSVAFASSNLITNPQFALVNFTSPYTLTNVSNPDPIEVAPGWVLVLPGTGSVTINRVALNSNNTNPSNAPYALRLTLTGWDNSGVYLRQRFQENGMLWANKYVSSTLTARVEGSPRSVNAILVDSSGVTLAEVLSVPAVNESWNEFRDYGQLPATTNTDIPPNAYVEYRLQLPNNVDIYLTSIQLVSQDIPIKPAFEQDTIERQIDHTFHNYKNSILLMPKSSILSGWNFGLNPWQFNPIAQTNLADNEYRADQTIVAQQNYVANAVGNNIATARASFDRNYGFEVVPVTVTNEFALIQYIDPTVMHQYWGYIMSSLAKIYINRTITGTPYRVKMRLIYRDSLPAATSQTYPISSWVSGQDPSFAAGWTAISPQNDVAYPLANGLNTIAFDKFQLPASTNANMTLGIVIYTIDNLGTTTPDIIVFNDVSLTPNEFAIESNVMTANETLQRCQFYYQKSFPMGVVPAANTGTLGAALGVQTTGASAPGSDGPIVRFPTYMRATPAITLYNPDVAASNQIYNNGVGASWTLSAASSVSQWGFVATGTTPGGSGVGNGLRVHWIANARMG